MTAKCHKFPLSRKSQLRNSGRLFTARAAAESPASCSMKYDCAVKCGKSWKNNGCFVPSAHFYLNFPTFSVLAQLYVALHQPHHLHRSIPETWTRAFFPLVLLFDPLFNLHCLDAVLVVMEESQIVNILLCTLDICLSKKPLENTFNTQTGSDVEYNKEMLMLRIH